MASAAYWIGTAADEIVVTPSGEVGSIGVFAVHKDMSKALEMEGVKVSLISEGRYKLDGNPYEPLAEEARAGIQERVSDYYESFIQSVARNRGVKPDAVRGGFGEGRVVGARQAIELGMADRIGILEETIGRLLGSEAANVKLSSTPRLTEDEEREAHTLSERVKSILRKEENHG